MDISLYSSHIDTLCDLKNIAEKHNCQIHFGVRHSKDDDIDYTILEGLIPKWMVREIKSEEYLIVSNAHSESTTYWFELYEKSKDKYHVLSYIQSNTSFNAEAFNYGSVKNIDKAEKVEKWLDENRSEYSDDKFFYYSSSPTHIYGFGNAKKIVDGRVYREGMALKYFGDLVCDYLEEERISRVY